MSGTSSTPIFDALSLELVFKDHAAQLADECEMPSSVLAGPSSADAFRAVIRVDGRRSGRSAEWDELVQRMLYGSPSPTPIYAEMLTEQERREMRESYYGTAWVEVMPDLGRLREGQAQSTMRPFVVNAATEFERALLNLWALGSAPVKAFQQYPAAVHELSRTTGWSLEESADIYERVAKWSAEAIAEDNIKTLNRSRMSKQNHYPTSSPSWARRK